MGCSSVRGCCTGIQMGVNCSAQFRYMKIVKLGLTSAIIFSLLFWAFTLLFPSNTVVSRAANMSVKADSLMRMLRSNQLSLQALLADTNSTLTVLAADVPFYRDNLFNALHKEAIPSADTIFFGVKQQGRSLVEGGIAAYQLEADSATVQLFYVFQTPWYKPLRKMKMMMADKAYGSGLDSILSRLKVMLFEN